MPIDSETLLAQVGVDPNTILDGLEDSERDLLEHQARQLNLNTTDLLALMTLHGLTLADLREAVRATISLLGRN